VSVRAGAPGPCGPGQSSRGSPGREPGRARCSRFLAFQRRSLWNAFPRPVARLASLHRRSPRGLRGPAMALLDFCPSRLLEVGSRLARPPSIPDRRPGFSGGCARWFDRTRREVSLTVCDGGTPFQSSSPVGWYRFPGPRPSCGCDGPVLQLRHRSASGPCYPSRSPRGLEGSSRELS